MKVAFVGFDLFYDCLCALEESGCEIIKIFTYKTDNEYEFNEKVLAFAKDRSIPVKDTKITVDDLAYLHDSGCELLISAGYIYKIPICRDFPMINVHPALLPLGRGPWPMPVTILRGLSESGITLHKLEESFDTGDILLQKKIDVCDDENLETLTEKLQKTAARAVREIVSKLDFYYNNSTPQGEGEYWAEPDDGEMTFYFDTEAEEIDRILRAFYGYGCYYDTGDEKILIKKGRIITDGDEASADKSLIKLKNAIIEYI